MASEPDTLNAPDWRWSIAGEMVRRSDPPDRGSDRLLIQAYRFLVRFKDPAATARLRLRKDYPEIYAAHALYRDPLSERWLIEAGLLSDVPFQELAEYVAQTARTVETYGALFFDVKEKMKSRGWVMTRILMPPRMASQPTDLDFLLKAVAYFAGWGVLREYLEAKRLSPGARTYLTEDYRDQVLRRSWEAAHRVEINKFNVVEVMEMQLKAMALDLQRGAVSEPELVIRLNAVFGGCRIGVAAPVPMIDELGPKALALPVPIRDEEKAGDGKAQ